MERQKLSDAAVGAGAFGGSRDALLQAEQYRGQMQQMADTAARLRSAGFQQAQQAGMGAFEAARSRDLGIAGLLGQTAGQTATLATQGQAQAGQDIATLQGLVLWVNNNNKPYLMHNAPRNWSVCTNLTNVWASWPISKAAPGVPILNDCYSAACFNTTGSSFPAYWFGYRGT